MARTQPAVPLPERVLEVAALGGLILPLYGVHDGGCRCNRPDCAGPGKHPIFARWPKHASSDPVTIERWWRQFRGQINFGWMMGSRFVALDLDRKHGRDGILSLHQLEVQGVLPRGCCASTPSGGGHIIFSLPDDVRIAPATDWRPAIDLRSGNSYIAIEPSRTDRGAYRFWSFGMPPPCPEWLLELLPRDKEPAAAVDVDDQGELPERAAALLEHDRTFRAVWDRTQGKQDGQDASNSGWDCSLAIAYLHVYRDADDQELADLIAAYRQRWGGWGKHERGKADYLARTIRAARQRIGGEIRHGGEVVVEGPAPPPWPAPLEEPAFYGLTARVVALIEPYVETDSVAVVCQFLAAYGVAVGIRPGFMLGATRHAPALFIALVGKSSRGRKGTSWDPIEALFRRADPAFGSRIFDGIGSGEKVVHLVHDAVYDRRGEVIEPAVEDKRLLFQAPELSQLLTVVNREGSTMSQILRNAYDGKPLRNLVKANAAESTVHHIGVIGQSTPTELRKRLTDDSIANGLGNRIMYFLTRRVKRIPDPGVFDGPAVDEVARDIAEHLRVAKGIHVVTRSPEAQALWNDWYSALPDGDESTAATLTARAEAHVCRLSMIYALTDGVAVIGTEHLRAAIAVWDYARRCVEHIWGHVTGDVIADKIFQESGYGPLTRTEINHDIFQRNVSAVRLQEALNRLTQTGLMVCERIRPESGGGRPTERWRRAEWAN